MKTMVQVMYRVESCKPQLRTHFVDAPTCEMAWDQVKSDNYNFLGVEIMTGYVTQDPYHFVSEGN